MVPEDILSGALASVFLKFPGDCIVAKAKNCCFSGLFLTKLQRVCDIPEYGYEQVFTVFKFFNGESPWLISDSQKCLQFFLKAPNPHLWWCLHWQAWSAAESPHPLPPGVSNVSAPCWEVNCSQVLAFGGRSREVISLHPRVEELIHCFHSGVCSPDNRGDLDEGAAPGCGCPCLPVPVVTTAVWSWLRQACPGDSPKFPTVFHKPLVHWRYFSVYSCIFPPLLKKTWTALFFT